MRNRDWNGDGFTAIESGLRASSPGGSFVPPGVRASPDFPRCLAAQTVHVVMRPRARALTAFAVRLVQSAARQATVRF
jgi:hypothetical protein